MRPVQISAIALIIAGALGLLFGAFSFTKQTHTAQLGELELTVRDRETVNIPVWAGVGAVLVGGFLLLAPRKRS